jgi:hypothetical protein
VQKFDISSGGGSHDFAATIKSIQDETQAIIEDEKAKGDLLKTEDQQVFAEEKVKKARELTQAAEKQGIDLTQEQKDLIEKTADAYAHAAAGVKGYANEQKILDEANKKAIEDQKKRAAQLAQMRDELASLSANFTMGFIQDIEGGMKATEALRDSLKKLADQLLSMALNSLFREMFAGLFDTTGAGTGKGGFFGNIASMFGWAHGGGVAGSFGNARSVSALAFAGAPRYHNGGIAGISSDEIPAILQRGETVLPRGAGSGPISNSIGAIHIDMSGTGKVASDTQKGAQFGDLVRKLIQHEMVAQSRPGGLLTSNGSGARVGR